MEDKANMEIDGGPIQNERLISLLRYWVSKSNIISPIPSRLMIDPGHIKSLLPIVLIADVSVPPRIRLMGTEATNAYGQEMRGKTIDRFDFGAFNKIWVAAFNHAVTGHKPVSRNGLWQRGDEVWRIEMLLLPLSSPDYELIQLFGGLVLLRQPFQSLTAFKPKPVEGSLFGLDDGISAGLAEHLQSNAS